MGLRRIVSGGQTGVDRGALDAALDRKLEHGGYCPRGRRAEDGSIPERYELDEVGSRSYAVRTEANVLESDATLVFTRGPMSGGTKLTAELARRYGRPVLVLDLEKTTVEELVVEVLAWLEPLAVEILNVAGPRESGAPGIGAMTREAIAALIDADRSTTE